MRERVGASISWPSRRADGRERGRDPLFARRLEEHRRVRGRNDRCRARAGRALSRSLADFASRLNPKALNKRGLETLAAAGAFDALETNRALVHRQRR